MENDGVGNGRMPHATPIPIGVSGRDKVIKLFFSDCGAAEEKKRV